MRDLIVKCLNFICLIVYFCIMITCVIATMLLALAGLLSFPSILVLGILHIAKVISVPLWLYLSLGGLGSLFWYVFISIKIADKECEELYNTNYYNESIEE